MVISDWSVVQLLRFDCSLGVSWNLIGSAVSVVVVAFIVVVGAVGFGDVVVCFAMGVHWSFSLMSVRVGALCVCVCGETGNVQ